MLARAETFSFFRLALRGTGHRSFSAKPLPCYRGRLNVAVIASPETELERRLSAQRNIQLVQKSSDLGISFRSVRLSSDVLSNSVSLYQILLARHVLLLGLCASSHFGLSSLPRRETMNNGTGETDRTFPDFGDRRKSPVRRTLFAPRNCLQSPSQNNSASFEIGNEELLQTGQVRQSTRCECRHLGLRDRSC